MQLVRAIVETFGFCRNHFSLLSLVVIMHLVKIAETCAPASKSSVEISPKPVESAAGDTRVGKEYQVQLNESWFSGNQFEIGMQRTAQIISQIAAQTQQTIGAKVNLETFPVKAGSWTHKGFVFKGFEMNGVPIQLILRDYDDGTVRLYLKIDGIDPEVFNPESVWPTNSNDKFSTKIEEDVHSCYSKFSYGAQIKFKKAKVSSSGRTKRSAPTAENFKTFDNVSNYFQFDPIVFRRLIPASDAKSSLRNDDRRVRWKLAAEIDGEDITGDIDAKYLFNAASGTYEDSPKGVEYNFKVGEDFKAETQAKAKAWFEALRDAKGPLKLNTEAQCPS